MDIMLEFVTAGPGISAIYTGANHYNAVTFVNPNSNLVPSTTSEEAANENPESVIEQLDEGSMVDNSDSESNEISAIPESNQLVIDGIKGDALVQSYLRPGTVFPTFLFKNVQPKSVTFLSPNINGNKYWLVTCSEKDLMKKCQERRWFYMRTSSKKGLRGVRKVGTCMGSWECSNPSCSFLSTEGKRNWWHFEYRNGTRVCYS